MSFPRYERYKDSGVEWLGEVPEHWSIRRMKTLFEIKKRIAGEIGYDILSITQNGIKKKDTESNEGQLAMWSARSFVPWSVSVAQLLLRSSSRRRGCGEVGSAFCFPLLHTLF